MKAAGSSSWEQDSFPLPRCFTFSVCIYSSTLIRLLFALVLLSLVHNSELTALISSRQAFFPSQFLQQLTPRWPACPISARDLMNYKTCTNYAHEILIGSGHTACSHEKYKKWMEEMSTNHMQSSFSFWYQMKKMGFFFFLFCSCELSGSSARGRVLLNYSGKTFTFRHHGGDAH